MEKVTFKIDYGRIVEHQGKLKGATLMFRAAGIEIYKKGVSSECHPDQLRNLAMNACINRHIPVISLNWAK